MNAAIATPTNGSAAKTTTSPATAGPAATEATAAAPAGEGKALADLLDELPEAVTDEEAGVTDAVAAATGEEQPSEEKPREQQPKPDDDAAIEAATDEKLFTDDALAQPEGVKRAAAVLKTAREALARRTGMLDRFDRRLSKRAQKLDTDRKAFDIDKQKHEQEVAPARAVAQRVLECARVLDPRSGATAKQRLAAIGTLLANDPSRGLEYYEDWSLGIANDGKTPAAPVDQEARERLERIERGQQETEERQRQLAQQQESARLTSDIQKRQAAIVESAKDAEKYPLLSRQLADEDPEEVATAESELAEYATALMVNYHERTGRLLAPERALGIIEQRLAKRVGAPAGRAGQSPERGSGEPTKTPRSPTSAVGKGKTVLPSSADRSTGIVREPKDQDERLRMNARDPELMDAIFGNRWRESRDD